MKAHTNFFNRVDGVSLGVQVAQRYVTPGELNLKPIWHASKQSDHSDASDSESEFEADEEELAEIESSDDESAYGDSNGGSDDSGSDFGGGDDESDEGQSGMLS